MLLKTLENLFTDWQMRRKARRMEKALRNILRDGDVRQIRRAALHLHDLGERLDVDEFKAIARQMDEGAEEIVLARVLKSH